MNTALAAKVCYRPCPRGCGGSVMPGYDGHRCLLCGRPPVPRAPHPLALPLPTEKHERMKEDAQRRTARLSGVAAEAKRQERIRTAREMLADGKSPSAVRIALDLGQRTWERLKAQMREERQGTLL